MKDLQAYMNEAVTNFRRGTTEMLLLSMLRNGERFATDMANELAEKCVGTFDLQIVHGQEYLEDFILQTEKTRDISSSRGSVYDCKLQNQSTFL